jgi:hypothetical protein
MIELTLATLLPIIVGIIIGLVAALKQGGLPTRYAPLAAVALGLAFGQYAIYLSNWPSALGPLYGFLAGLTACGLYDVPANLCK